MTFYAIYHRPTKTFACDGSFSPYNFEPSFTGFSRETKIYANPGPAKAYITSALKSCKRDQRFSNVAEATQFALGLEVVEVDIQPQIERSVYSASFNLDKL
jgi:hypothetical protein